MRCHGSVSDFVFKRFPAYFDVFLFLNKVFSNIYFCIGESLGFIPRRSFGLQLVLPMAFAFKPTASRVRE